MSDLKFTMTQFNEVSPIKSGGYFARLVCDDNLFPTYKVVLFDENHGWILVPEDHEITHVTYLEDIENQIGENNG